MPYGNGNLDNIILMSSFPKDIFDDNIQLLNSAVAMSPGKYSADPVPQDVYDALKPQFSNASRYYSSVQNDAVTSRSLNAIKSLNSMGVSPSLTYGDIPRLKYERNIDNAISIVPPYVQGQYAKYSRGFKHRQKAADYLLHYRTLVQLLNIKFYEPKRYEVPFNGVLYPTFHRALGSPMECIVDRYKYLPISYNKGYVRQVTSALDVAISHTSLPYTLNQVLSAISDVLRQVSRRRTKLKASDDTLMAIRAFEESHIDVVPKITGDVVQSILAVEKLLIAMGFSLSSVSKIVNALISDGHNINLLTFKEQLINDYTVVAAIDDPSPISNIGSDVNRYPLVDGVTITPVFLRHKEIRALLHTLAVRLFFQTGKFVHFDLPSTPNSFEYGRIVRSFLSSDKLF